jgi:glycosyltransferase involved in cell wall biosynthesis
MIPNGVDRSRFYPGAHDRLTLLYCSAPNRGLKRLPLILDALRRRVSPAVRCLAFSNLQQQHPAEILDEDPFTAVYQSVAESSVELRNPVPQTELAEVMRTAGVLIMPSDYPEICSNNVLQALASGLPVITTRMGSAEEWVKSGRNGHLIDWWPQHGMIYDVEFVRRLMATISSEKTYQWMSKKAYQTPLWTWPDVGRAWERLCSQLC